MPYYSWFRCHDRAVLANELGVEDPFGMAPADVVDRIVATGYTPALDFPRDDPFPSFGTLTEIEREGRTYLVAISRDAEEIGVQEWRDEGYDVVE